MPESIVLIPTYNERENIGQVVSEVFAAHPELYILVIDDNSPDGTGEVVRELMKTYSNLSLLSRPKKEGLGEAYRHAISHVLSERNVARIIMMDADGSHDVEYLTPMLAASEHFDVVIGSRYTSGGKITSWVLWRRILSRCGNMYARILTGLPVQDMTSGFICINERTLKHLDLSKVGASGYAFLIDLKFHMIRELGASVKEIPILLRSRREGESKISRHIIREGLITPMRHFAKRISITRVLSCHVAIFAFAILAGVLTMAPQIIVEHRLGDAFQGVHREMNSDEVFYMTRAHEAIDGHPTLGNTYLYEYKIAPPPEMWVPDVMLAWGSEFFFHDLRTGSLVWDFVFPAIILLLTYAILFLITRERALSLGIAVLLSIGRYLVLFNRSPSPQFNLVFFLLLMLAIVLLVQRNRRVFALFCVLVFGSLFYIYTYYWTYAVVFLAIACIACFFFCRKEGLHRSLAAVLGGGLMLGIPYFWITYKAMQLPDYRETLSRIGMIQTHFPSGIFIIVAGTATLIVSIILWRRRILQFSPLSIVLGSAVLAGIVAANQHIITGINIDFSTHYHWVAVYADVFLLALCAKMFLDHAGSRRNLIMQSAVALMLLYSFFSAARVVWAQSMPDDTFVQNQRFGPVLRWLDTNTQTDDVVYADRSLSALIPAYTRDNVFFAEWADLFFVPQADIKKRFLLQHYFDAPLTSDEIKKDEREVFGLYYINTAAHLSSINSVRRLLGLAPLKVDRYPENEIESLVESERALRTQSFSDDILGYRLDYIVWDHILDPKWNLDRIPGLRVVYEVNSITVYAFPNAPIAH